MTWRTAGATGIGSLPGEDPLEAARLVLGELPLPHLPELPGRGPHADMAGRGAALLSDLHVDLQPTGWRLVPRPSRDGRRARDLLARDLDALEQIAQSLPPAALKVQATGPWTLASVLELHRGDKVLADRGAVADLTASLAQGLREHLADLTRRLPATTLVLQLDEPALPAVLAGQVPTSSGFGTLRSVDDQTARAHLRTVLDGADHTVLHCCAARPPLSLLAEADAVSVDAAADLDENELGTILDAGTGLWLGVLPGIDGPLAAVREIVQTVGRLRDRVGVDHVTLTPTCGLAGATPDYAKQALRRLAEAAREVNP